jgi:nucleotidyltransferase/DNA polymerase involved in DNA repair
MADKKMRDVPGVGHVTEQTLNGLGVHSCLDIENHLVEIYMNYSETFFEFIVKASMGIGRNKHNELESDLKKKSISFTLSFRSITRFE